MKYKFQISALNIEKIIIKLSKEFDIFDLKKQDDFCTFYCQKKHYKKIKKILQKNNIKIINSNYVGLSKIHKNLTSIGIISGIIISGILWIISSFFITDVLFIGNLSLTSNDVLNILKNNNINKWTLKSNINIQSLQNQIQDIKHISYVSIIIKGNALVINIKEQLTNQEVISLGQYQPLISNYQGKVTSIKLIQGTPKVNVGDIVRVGDVLVEPYTTSVDGTKLSVQPLADIVCEVWVTTSQDYYQKQTKKVYTGKKVSNYTISFIGIDIYKHQTQVDFLNYDSTTTQNYLTTSLLPLKITYNNYFEYNLEEEIIDFETSKQKFIEQTRQMALLNIKEYDIIINESYSIIAGEGKNTIVYTITLNKKIC